ncbi:MAG TPA: gliding motility-associated C-terminal domain-containing protein, partial [Chitinophagaceae bacterium]|nr:gliding motility-associated C-terminal domain-containing protein [Chitinophagaceae bacterium]
QREITHQVQYTVTDSFGCQQTITKPIIIYSSCTVFIPNAFTPNGDGKNDVFGVINAVKADQFQLQIYNRWGGLVFRSNNWKDTWDGKVNGLQQAAGTFVWFVKYVDKRTNEKVERKGSLVLIR